ncbi:MAG: NUMOD3 domain-containing DNA-binding protein, partial [Rickettsiales bacterium]
ELRNYVVYKHTSPKGKGYVGITNNYDRRCKQHQNKNGCRLFYRAVKKYGWDNFTHEILENGLTLSEANTFERLHIEQYKTLAPNGYNLMTGGDVSTHCEETRAKLSEANKGKVYSQETIAKMKESGRRKVITPEHRMKLNQSLWGRVHSNETRGKISNANKGKRLGENHHCFGRTGEKHPMFGKKLNDSQKNHLSIELKGKMAGDKHPNFGIKGKDSPTSKEYMIITPSGEKKIIKGLSLFCIENNLDASNMVKVYKGIKQHHKGYKCKKISQD